MTNPFKPTAGRIPPILVGREEIIEDFDYALKDGVGSPGRLMFLTGARGVGKTVMLDTLGTHAQKQGWQVYNESADSGFTSKTRGLTYRQRYHPHICIRHAQCRTDGKHRKPRTESGKNRTRTQRGTFLDIAPSSRQASRQNGRKQARNPHHLGRSAIRFHG